MEEIRDLIPRDVSRCNDEKCPIKIFCERYLQISIDRRKERESIWITDFKGSEKVGLCDYFLNVDVLEEE